MNKLEVLKSNIYNLNKVCVAFSGGVDSTFLLKVCKDTLGDNVLAIIANGLMLPQREFNEAVKTAKEIGVNYYVIEADVLAVKEFKENHKLRCYHCKKNIFSQIIEKAKEMGYPYVLDGKNADDNGAYRPGQKATAELGVVSPLSDAGLTKQEIRDFSKQLCLKTWDKPANACLATRLPYDTTLSEELLKRIEKCEDILNDEGITGGRARVHGDILRLELNKKDFNNIVSNEILIKKIKEIGFKYITLDLEGFRSGSMD